MININKGKMIRKGTLIYFILMSKPSSKCSEKLEAIVIDKKMRIIPIGKMSCLWSFSLNKSTIPMMAPYKKMDDFKKTVINNVNTTMASSLSIKSNKFTFPIVASVGNVDLSITSTPRTDRFKAAVQLKMRPLEITANNHTFFAN